MAVEVKLIKVIGPVNFVLESKNTSPLENDFSFCLGKKLPVPGDSSCFPVRSFVRLFFQSLILFTKNQGYAYYHKT